EDIKELIKSLYEVKVKGESEYFKERPLLSAMACGTEIAKQEGDGDNVFISVIDTYLKNVVLADSTESVNSESVSNNNRYIS
ncbi:hypothetical protein OFB58_27510, partial [Escherichia coli]|nr:hypothetical protein [Escherichia coli]